MVRFDGGTHVTTRQSTIEEAVHQPMRLFRRRGIGLLIAAVVVFSAAADIVLILQQRDKLIDMNGEAVQHQLQFVEQQLMSDVASDRLDVAVHVLDEWAQAHPQLLALTVVDGQDNVRVHSGSLANSPFTFSYVIAAETPSPLTLMVVLDHRPINAMLLEFALKLAVVTVVIALVFGLLFWQGLKKVAVTPLKMEISRHKATQAALRRERDTGQRYLDTAEVMLLALDVHGCVTLINRKGCEMIGYDERELKGRNWFETCVVDGAQSRSQVSFRRFIAEQKLEANEYEDEVVTKSGERRVMVWRCNLLTKGSGNVIGAICSGEDVTVKRKAAQALADSELRLRTLFDNVEDCIITIDEQGIVESVNDATVRVFGYDEQALVGHNVSVLMDAPDAVEHDGYLRSFLETGVAKVLGKGPRPVLGKRKDGSLCELELMVSEMWLGGRRVFIGILRDVTLRNERERELQRSREELATIIANTGDVFFAVDEDLRLRQLNGRAEKFFGRSQPSLIGQVLWDVAPELVSYFYKAFNMAVNQSRTETFEGYYPPQDVWFEARVCPSLDGVGVFLTDISMRKTYQRKLQALHDTAVSATERQAAFLANMSHEIRTPINGVLGVLQLLDDGTLDDAQHQLLASAYGCGQTLLTLINDLLDFSKIGAGKLTLEAIDFELRNQLDDVLDVVAQRALEKGLNLSVIVAPDAPHWVVGDPMRLNQILTNLIGNAVKFTHQGEVWVEVSLLSRLAFDGQTLLEFNVCDTGVGIKEEGLDTIFEPFTQADVSTVREYGGTGLGLAITRQLVEAMGGEIGVTSTLNQGSVFTFTVSLGISDQAAPPLALPRTCDVLVATAHAHTRQALAVCLEFLGVRHREIGDETQVLAALSEPAPLDVLMLDVALTGGEPWDMLASISQCRASEALTVVLLTPLGFKLSQRSTSFKTIECLPKPVRQRALSQVLKGWTDDGVKTNAAAQSQPVLEASSNTGPVRVLVVEDNEVNRRVTTSMLSKLGYSCDVVFDGHEAVAAVAAGDYDLVLMDCQMPVLSGFEATERIRAAEIDGRHVTIIAMTANAMGGDRKRCLEVGMDDYMSKPIQVGLLRDVLEKWLPASDCLKRAE